ncbi:MAG: hypothetical protein JEY91_15910 [Spirochaetaceae bacterium]|nr:hypothetical protein [Spirochaetaceae bacterium]
MRFATVDLIQGGTNWYVYCNNNPLSFVDPTGLEDKKIIEEVESSTTETPDPVETDATIETTTTSTVTGIDEDGIPTTTTTTTTETQIKETLEGGQYANAINRGSAILKYAPCVIMDLITKVPVGTVLAGVDIGTTDYTKNVYEGDTIIETQEITTKQFPDSTSTKITNSFSHLRGENNEVINSGSTVDRIGPSYRWFE